MNESSIPDIDRTIHEPARLAILGQLCVVASADFLFLQRQTGLTQGNLSSHMSKLETAGYITIEKGFAGKRPRTLLRITDAGRTALHAYVAEMQEFLGQVPAAKRTAKPRRRTALKPLTACLLLALAPHLRGQAPETVAVSFPSHDGHAMNGKLTLPAKEGRHAVVVYVQTAEGMTVDVRRPKPGGGFFNYFDLYREKLPEMNVAFFSYEGRGIGMGDAPPRYESIDEKAYNTSTLENKVRDIIAAVAAVKKQKGVDAGRVYLMGTSEGTLLAAEAAARAPESVHGLILYSILTPTLRAALRYQAADGAFLVMNSMFDTDKDGRTSKAEFEADPRKSRERALRGAAFEQLDPDGDGYFAVEDLRKLRKPLVDAVDKTDFAAINAWLKSASAVALPAGWVEDHFAHADMWSFLSKLTMPVGLFHGAADNLTPIAETKVLELQAKSAGKKNLQFFYFDGLDHSLSITPWFARRVLPAGHAAMFEFIRRLVEPPAK